MKECKSCKEEVKSEAKICPHCGQHLTNVRMVLMIAVLAPTVLIVGAAVVIPIISMILQ